METTKIYRIKELSLRDVEVNVLQIALSHLEEHLNDILQEEDDLDSLERIKFRLGAVKELEKKLNL
jgi:hypothetical protein